MAKGRHVPVKLGLVCDEFAVQYCDLLKMPELFGDMVCCDVDPPAFDGTIPTLITLNLVQNDNIYDASIHFSTGGRISNYTLVNAPAWMTINRYNGVISGTPAPDAATDYLSVQVQGSNSAGDAVSNTFTMSVTANAPVFSGGPIPPINVQEDQAITPPISMAGYFTTGGPVETYSLTNAPLWLDIDPVTGDLSGTPTTGADALGVTINATNVDGTDSSNAFDITVVDVVDAPIYSGVPIPPISGNVGVAITPYDVAAGGHFIGDDPPTVYQLFNAPTGITINASTGVISGASTVSGMFSTLYVRATNNAGGANTDPFTADISAVVLPLFSRPFSETASLEDDATFARGSTGSVQTFEQMQTALENESRFEGANRIENLFTDTTTTLASGVATTAVSVGVGDFVFSMGAGSGTATFSGTATGSTGTLDADSSSRTAEALSITGAGTIIVTASVADLADIMLQNKTGSSTPTIPDEYVSVGVGTGDEEVTNGTFDADISGWNNDGTLPCDTLEWQSGKLHIINTAGTTQAAYSDDNIAQVAGQTYQFTADVVKNSGTDDWDITIKEAALATTRETVTTSATTESISYTYVAAITENVVIQLTPRSTFDGTIDNISIRRADHGANVDGVKYSTFDNGNTVDGNGIVTEAQGSPLSGISLLMEPSGDAFQNNADDLSGGADTIDLTTGGTGDFTLWVTGTAAVTVAAGTATGTGFAQATAGSPVTFNLSVTGTVTLTLDSGSLDTLPSGNANYQVETGAIPTSLIECTGTPLSRAVDTLQYPLVTPQTEGMAIIEFAQAHPEPDDIEGMLTFSAVTTQGPLCVRGNGAIQCRDGTNLPAQGWQNNIIAYASSWSAANGMSISAKLSTTDWEAWNNAAYDGDFTSNGNLYIGYSNDTSIYRIKTAEIFDVDLGTQWLEDNR